MKYLFPHFFLLTIMLLMLSCSERKHLTSLEYADSIMESVPDSAYHILNSLSDSVEQFVIKDRMMYYTLLADACNKLYKPLPSDTILNEVVDYYDSYGSANQKMKSRYLLGCYYRDNNDAPLALKQYQEAVECADTLDSKCDFVTLFSIYGQIAELFYLQYLEEKAIDAYKKYSHYALKSGNIYNSIRGIEFQIQPYSLLKDTVKVLELTDSVHRLFMKNNMPDKASRIYTRAIFIALERKDLKNAKRMMDEFDSNSGIYVNDSLTDKRYTRYYYAKGLYYLNVGEKDSAEFFFRRLLSSDNKNKYDAYDGLTRLYRSESNIDSTLKYSALRDDVYEDIFSGMQADAVRQVSAMYDYEKLEHQKDIYLLESDKSKLILWIGLSVFLILLLSASIGFIIFRKNKKRETEILRMRFINTLVSLDKLKSELNNLTFAYNELERNSLSDKEKLSDFENKIKAKQDEIEYIEKIASEYKNKYNNIIQGSGLDRFRESSVIQSIRIMYNSPSADTIFIKNEEKKIYKELKSSLPVFYHKITVDINLSNQEKLTAILILADFSTKEIAYILKTSISRISNIKSSLNYKLFGEESSRKLSENLKRTASDVNCM